MIQELQYHLDYGASKKPLNRNPGSVDSSVPFMHSDLRLLILKKTKSKNRCPPNRWLQASDGIPLRKEEKSHILKLVEICLKRTALNYLLKYFRLKRHDIHDYDIRNKIKLVIDRVK